MSCDSFRVIHESRTEEPVLTTSPAKRGAAPNEVDDAVLPGISTMSARALLARFASVAGVLSAGPEEWLEVPGIGPDRAKALAETLTRPHPPN